MAAQLVYFPATPSVSGAHHLPLLMVVPLGAPLPAGAMRLAASSAGSTASARGGHPHPSAVGRASPRSFRASVVAGPRSAYSGFPATIASPFLAASAFRAPDPLAPRPSKTVASASKENGGLYEEDGGSDAKDHAKDAGSAKETRKGAKDHAGAGSADASGNVAEGSPLKNPEASKDHGGAGFGNVSDGSPLKNPEASKDAKNQGGANSAKGGYIADGSHDKKPQASKHDGSAEKNADGSLDKNPGASKDDDLADLYFPFALPSDFVAPSGDTTWSAMWSTKASNDQTADGSPKEYDDNVADDGHLQARIDPRMIVAELDLFGLGYDPLESLYNASTVSFDELVRRDIHSGMLECNYLLLQAMTRRPPLAEHSKTLVLIGKSFCIVSKEAQKGFVQSTTVLAAIEGLKSMGKLFLGPNIGFLKPLPSREFPVKPPPGSDEKLYFNKLLDHYHTVYDCVRTEILACFAIDGYDDNLDGFD